MQEKSLKTDDSSRESIFRNRNLFMSINGNDNFRLLEVLILSFF